MQEFIDTCLHRNMDTSTIIAEGKRLYLTRVQRQYKLPSHAEVLEALESGNIPTHRDLFVNSHDIANRRMFMEKRCGKTLNNASNQSSDGTLPQVKARLNCTPST